MSDTSLTRGRFVQRHAETYYKIEQVDQMPAFFISLVSDQDHWLFAGSLGGITAGRVSPETALFPYQCVDKLYDSAASTGAKTLVKVQSAEGGSKLWEPFNLELDGKYQTERNLYKNALGNKLCFEEINHDLSLKFEYEWQFSEKFGVVRQATIANLGDSSVSVELLDGLLNILPAGTPRFTQTQSSNLVDAYKFNELDISDGLALYSLYSAITDRAEPAESLRATTVFSLGFTSQNVLLDGNLVRPFKQGKPLSAAHQSRGIRGAYLLNQSFNLAGKEGKDWLIIANTEQNQSQIHRLKQGLQHPQAMLEAVREDVQNGSEKLKHIMGVTDGFQLTAESEVSLHHYANTLFNVLRGGYFANQYCLDTQDLANTVRHFNRLVFERNADWFDRLDDHIRVDQLKQLLTESKDPQLIRLVNEYLPVTFGRRHGDPSRPWNQFAIELKDEMGQLLLSYQGNWRDIFQNWEALLLSYPKFTSSVIAKFVNASTMDGYNPYRITKQGIDWEVEEPDDPWSYIGYWGDHQIIYLLKLLEVSHKFAPTEISTLLSEEIYAYANVPYRIRSYQALCENPKETVDYDQAVANQIEKLQSSIGADAKLVLDDDLRVYQVNLCEKLLVALLTKLSNLVIDGGIWLNTQRPEWNDANNALVGQGLSMVTLYYINRYIHFFEALLHALPTSVVSFKLTSQVADWLNSTAETLVLTAERIDEKVASNSLQKSYLDSAGEAASGYRNRIYQHTGSFTKSEVRLTDIQSMLSAAKLLVLHSIDHNRKSSGMYHAYNVLKISENSLAVSHLYDMLEGQVAVLSSGALSPSQAVTLLDALFASEMYRADIDTFMLYPDREQLGFMHKNRITDPSADTMPLVNTMLENRDYRLIQLTESGQKRFSALLFNQREIERLWPQIVASYPELATDEAYQQFCALYEITFKHAEFTGRSGGMFGFEGLGCVYWHMISKLLLAVQEVATKAYRSGAPETAALMRYYYKVRQGIGFNKQPSEYGAFPTDPYSHTPKHAGAQQPGMTGQVKEELITRLVELGCFTEQGVVSFEPFLLRKQEFATAVSQFTFVNLDEQSETIAIPAQSLAFTWCQVPIIYTLVSEAETINIDVYRADDDVENVMDSSLSPQLSQSLFSRDGSIKKLHVTVPEINIFEAICGT